MDKLKSFLQSLTPFSDEDFEKSKPFFRTLELKKGDALVEQGKICKQIAFINYGSFRTYYFNEKSEEITACFRTEMSVVSSYRSFVLQEPSSLAVVALEDSEVIVIEHEGLHKLYEESIPWLKIGRLIAEAEYINMEEYASVLNHESAKAKYLRLIKEQGQVINKVKVEHVASYLGVTRRTLSRIRQEILA